MAIASGSSIIKFARDNTGTEKATEPGQPHLQASGSSIIKFPARLNESQNRGSRYNYSLRHAAMQASKVTSIHLPECFLTQPKCHKHQLFLPAFESQSSQVASLLKRQGGLIGSNIDTCLTLACAVQMAAVDKAGIRSYYIAKIDSLDQEVGAKAQNLRRLEAQRNELNSRGLLRLHISFQTTML